MQFDKWFYICVSSSFASSLGDVIQLYWRFAYHSSTNASVRMAYSIVRAFCLLFSVVVCRSARTLRKLCLFTCYCTANVEISLDNVFSFAFEIFFFFCMIFVRNRIRSTRKIDWFYHKDDKCCFVNIYAAIFEKKKSTKSLNKNKW